jgi:Ca2+-binding RTX toxin-like protein
MATFIGRPEDPNVIAFGQPLSPGVAVTGTPTDLSGNDSVVGGGKADLIDGGPGLDTLKGGGGGDTLLGGTGDDLLDAGPSDDGVDSLTGGSGDDTLRGLSLGDIARGGADDDLFIVEGEGGEGGVALVEGGGGDDTVRGASPGAIVDLARFGAVTSLSGVEALGGSARLTGAQVAQFSRLGDVTAGVEDTIRLRIVGSGLADLTGRVADALDRFEIDGASLTDALNVRFDPKRANRVAMTGTAADDTLAGGAGNDTLSGRFGADVLSGGGGADLLIATDGDPSDGSDSLDGGGGADTARGGDGDDLILAGGDLTGVIDGGAGTDKLDAGGDLTGATITGIELSLRGATFTGAQLNGFSKIGAGTPGAASFHAYRIVDAAFVDLTGKIADALDSFRIDGPTGGDAALRVRFDPGSSARVELVGRSGDDSLEGGAGADTLRGGGGADTLKGGGGADLIDAGGADLGELPDIADSLEGGYGADTLTGLGALDVAKGDGGNDRFEIEESGVAVIDGGAGTDTLVPLFENVDLSTTSILGVERMWSSARLTGAQLTGFATVGVSTPGAASTHVFRISDGTLADLTGAVGDALDVIELRASGGAARLRGDAGLTARVILTGGSGADVLEGGGGADTIVGGAGGDTIYGFGGSDRIDAGGLDGAVDGIDAGGGDDTVTGLGAGDSVFGFGGDDRFELSEGGVANINGATGVDTLVAKGHSLVGTRIDAVENLADSAILTSAQAVGFARIGTGSPIAAATYTLIITDGAVAVDLTGKFADGFDRFFVDSVSRGLVNDRFWVSGLSPNDVRLRGFAGADSLRGGGGDDTLEGGSGDDTLDGGRGDNVILGGSGVDTLSFQSFGEGVTFSLGVAGKQTPAPNATITWSGVERLIGSNFKDALSGGGGDDRLDGAAGGDTLSGGSGADTLAGGAGADMLTGGSGLDRFVFAPGGGTDTVTDFETVGERLIFSGFGAAFDTDAEVLAAARDIGADVLIDLGSTRIILSSFGFGGLTADDIDFA